MSEILTRATYQARESWLASAVEIFRPNFEDLGIFLPQLRVSVGFGPYGAKQENTTVLGICMNPALMDDEVYEIFISPISADAVSLLATLLHELIHTVAWADDHGGQFAVLAKKLGLEGKMTHTVPSALLILRLIEISNELGKYPGSRMDLNKLNMKNPTDEKGAPLPISSGGPTQTTRMIKLMCLYPDCECEGYFVRTTRKHIAKGYPSCPYGGLMTESD